MKGNKILIFLVMLSIIMPIFPFISTVEAAAPTITTNDATGVQTTNATLRGTITNDGGANFRYEYCADSPSGDYDAMIWGYAQGCNAQIFTVGTVGANLVHTIQAVSLPLQRIGSPGDVAVSIRAVSAGKPTGSDLSLGLTNGNTLPASGYEWRTTTLSPVGAPWTVAIGTPYAVVVKCSNTGAGNAVYWNGENSNVYTGGTMLSSTDNGATWTISSGIDMKFKEYGNGCNASFNYGTTTGYGTNTAVQPKVTSNTVS
ncbi:MAG: hypothetical protein IMZ52_01205, partial [Actinobacteria bacterium]|nr:hypothetical protein [Actinomycetota bacterium]